MSSGKWKLRVPLDELADLVGLNVQTVRKHCREGVFDRCNLESVVEYVVKRRNR